MDIASFFQPIHKDVAPTEFTYPPFHKKFLGIILS